MSRNYFNVKKAMLATVSLILTITIVVLLSLIPVSAVGSVERGEIINNKKLYEDNKQLCDRIAQGMNNLQDQIYIGDITFDEKRLPYIVKTALRMHPELFFVSTTKLALGRDGNGKIAVACPFYLADKSEIAVQREKFNARVNEILSLISYDMSDFKKALIIHDEIALNCSYLNEDETSKNVTAYDCLINRLANCQGYAGAYAYLLSLSGVSSEIVESSAMFHVWNSVCIDGEFYNVDITLNDPVNDKPGRVNHRYFLLSNSIITTKGDQDLVGHHGFGYESIECTSTKYDYALFHQIDSKFCYIGNDCYSVNNKYGSTYQNCLLKYDPENLNTADVEIVKSFSYKWKSGETQTSYWKNNHMSLDVYNDLLYCNSPNEVFIYDPLTGTTEQFYGDKQSRKAITAGNSYYGMVIVDGVAYVAENDSPNNPAEVYSFGNCIMPKAVLGATRNITLKDKTKAGILYGDANLNGKIDITDATEIQKYSARIIDMNESNLIASDVNNDGEVNINDCTMVQKYLAHLL